MSACDAGETRAIARHRVHAEHLLCQVKEDKFFDAEIPLSFLETLTTYILLHVSWQTMEMGLLFRLEQRSQSRTYIAFTFSHLGNVFIHSNILYWAFHVIGVICTVDLNSPLSSVKTTVFVM